MRENKDNKYYKGRFMIVFYDETDEEFVAGFTNIKQLCLYKNKELTATNINLVSVEVYRALKREDHSTRMLNGSLNHIHLIDIEDDEDI